ncbi:MAG TPA: hypothetical protein PKG90_02165 [Chitinophagaceae bacterium]|nr:hypothetical protein [Chitinophagaceae bacterium]HNU14110.1 hypothetical protein [Chitinophagaceae bacterium]
MIKFLRKFSINLILLGIFFFTGCKKENSQSGSTEEQEKQASIASAEADTEAENIFDSFFDDAMGANNDVGVSGSGIFYGRIDTLTPVLRCFTVTVQHPNNTPFPVRVIVDFGTTGCTGPDGRMRTGKIITDYTARLIVPGAVATTTFEGFYIDSLKVEGIHKVTNTSEPNANPAILRRYKAQVINGKLTRPNRNFAEWNSTKVFLQIDGLATPDFPRDDAFKIDGFASGRAKRGNLIVRWESNITEALLRRFTCRHIVKGKIRTVRAGLGTQSSWVALLDFGNGTCDNLAVVTINGVSYQITLP